MKDFRQGSAVTPRGVGENYAPVINMILFFMDNAREVILACIQSWTSESAA